MKNTLIKLMASAAIMSTAVAGTAMADIKVGVLVPDSGPAGLLSIRT